MRLDMIGNGRRYGEPALGAEPTQRLGHQLMPCNVSPTLRIVEGVVAALAGHWFILPLWPRSAGRRLLIVGWLARKAYG
jgi:hypothetical protein